MFRSCRICTAEGHYVITSQVYYVCDSQGGGKETTSLVIVAGYSVEYWLSYNPTSLDMAAPFGICFFNEPGIP